MRLSDLINELRQLETRYGNLYVVTTSESMTHTDIVSMSADKITVDTLEELCKRYLFGHPTDLNEKNLVVLL